MELAKSEPKEDVSHQITLEIVDQVNQTFFCINKCNFKMSRQAFARNFHHCCHNILFSELPNLVNLVSLKLLFMMKF